jgi:hypothetical protein
MRKSLWYVLLILGSVVPTSAYAATITASNCSSSAVQAAVNAAANGDTVIIPSGSCAWASGITTNKQIKIRGQAQGSVFLTLAGPMTMFVVTAGSSFSTEIAYLNFLPGSGTGNYVKVFGSPTARPTIIHHNDFQIPNFQLIDPVGKGSLAIQISRYRGVLIHHNVFSSTVKGTSNDGTQSVVIQLKDTVNANLSWTSDSTLGTDDIDGTQNIYIEDNVFNNLYKTALDCDDGTRLVLRHNIFNNSAFGCHMADTSTYGVRHTEIYDNTFVFNGSGTVNGTNYPINLSNGWIDRIGGTGVFTGNIVPDINSQKWGNKAEMVLIVQNLHRNQGPYPCVSTYPAPHQLGQSHDGTRTITDPYYIWGNSGSAASLIPQFNDYSPDQCGRDYVTWTTRNWQKAGRDYILGTPRPGWTRYTYPHPLSGGTSTSAAPSAPSNTSVR